MELIIYVRIDDVRARTEFVADAIEKIAYSKLIISAKSYVVCHASKLADLFENCHMDDETLFCVNKAMDLYLI